jgi:hypothetical protein
MRTVLAMSLLFATEALAADHHFVSPHGEFEAYTIAANEDGTGMKLFMRRANSPDPGVLLRQNNRWIESQPVTSHCTSYLCKSGV